MYFKKILYNPYDLISQRTNTRMSKEDTIEVEGTILKSLPGLVFEVQLPADLWLNIVRWHLSGNMRKNYIKLIEWDRVTIELSPYDPEKGRITYRFTPERT